MQLAPRPKRDFKPRNAGLAAVFLVATLLTACSPETVEGRRAVTFDAGPSAGTDADDGSGGVGGTPAAGSSSGGSDGSSGGSGGVGGTPVGDAGSTGGTGGTGGGDSMLDGGTTVDSETDSGTDGGSGVVTETFMACDDSGASSDTCLTTSDFTVQYRSADDGDDKWVRPYLNIVNAGSNNIPLSEFTIRYWYTIDTPGATQVFQCFYAAIDCGNVQGSFGSVTADNADAYFEVSFSGGTLAAGSESGEMQTAFHKEPFDPAYNLDDDWSYDPSSTTFTDNPKITLYHNGKLVWGIEP